MEEMARWEFYFTVIKINMYIIHLFVNTSKENQY